MPTFLRVAFAVDIVEGRDVRASPLFLSPQRFVGGRCLIFDITVSVALTSYAL